MNCGHATRAQDRSEPHSMMRVSPAAVLRAARRSHARRHHDLVLRARGAVRHRQDWSRSPGRTDAAAAGRSGGPFARRRQQLPPQAGRARGEGNHTARCRPETFYQYDTSTNAAPEKETTLRTPALRCTSAATRTAAFPLISLTATGQGASTNPPFHRVPAAKTRTTRTSLPPGSTSPETGKIRRWLLPTNGRLRRSLWPAVPRTTSRPTALPPCLKAQCLLPNSNKLLPKCSMQRLPSGLFLKTQQTESSIHHVGGQKKKKKRGRPDRG